MTTSWTTTLVVNRLAVVAADERDVVRVRSNVRGEDVRIYRLRMTPANAQVLLREYVEEANSLARAPRFHNTLTANCTNLVFDMVRVIHPVVPMDVRVLFSGSRGDPGFRVEAETLVRQPLRRPTWCGCYQAGGW
jgi:hypothetical protein